MLSYLKLIRVPNLLFAALVLFLMEQMVIVPILQVYGFDGSASGMHIYLLIGAVVLIAAGGYVINDYFDTKIDAVNKPDRLIVGRTISKTNTMRFYQVLTSAGVLLGLLLAFMAKSYTLAFIFIFVPGLLWFYSSNYKRQFLIGNLVISFNTALTVLSAAIMETAFLQLRYGSLIFDTPVPKTIYGWVSGFALFAFMLTLIREIIKDMEDIAGDREAECRTLPIKQGIKRTKTFLYVLIALTIAALLVINSACISFEGSLTLRYILIGVVLPLAVLVFLIARAKSSEDFHHASTLAKFIMLTGVLYSLVFYYLQAKTYGISIFGLFLVN